MTGSHGGRAILQGALESILRAVVCHLCPGAPCGFGVWTMAAVQPMLPSHAQDAREVFR